MQHNKHASTADDGFYATQTVEKSPFIEGLKTGLKAALVGGPAAAGAALVTGHKSPLLMGSLGAIGSAALFGLGGAANQSIQNRIREAEIKYYLRNMAMRGAISPDDLRAGLSLPPPPQGSAIRVY